ncbi:MAG: hypothetical protein J5996_04885 [Prevotella sp.]|nr:hypothetical protein [Prevotella sp.]
MSIIIYGFIRARRMGEEDVLRSLRQAFASCRPLSLPVLAVEPVRCLAERAALCCRHVNPVIRGVEIKKG